MCCFNKVNLSAILLVHKCKINKDCTVKNNNEVYNLDNSLYLRKQQNESTKKCLHFTT